MHYLAYVLLEKDCDDIEHEVQRVLEPFQYCNSCGNPNVLLDWYLIGGRWNNYFDKHDAPIFMEDFSEFRGNIQTTKNALEYEFPEYLFTHDGEYLVKNTWDRIKGEYLNDEKQNTKKMKEFLSNIYKDCIVIVADIHN